MFPLRDNIPSRRFPVVNICLLAGNVFFFMYEFGLGEQISGFLFSWGFVPARFFATHDSAALDFSRFLPVFSSMFLHGGFLHLLSNMWMLWIFGDNVEDSMGHGRYLVFYLACGGVAVAAQAVMYPLSEVPMIGASGAISGVLGAYLLTYPRARILTLVPIIIFFTVIEIPAFVFLLFWFVLQFLQGSYHLLTFGSLSDGGVAWWAHVGGFVAGAVLIFFFRQRNGNRRRSASLEFL